MSQRSWPGADQSDCELETLSARIIDLRDLVTLSHLQSPSESPSHLRTNGAFSPRSPLGEAGGRSCVNSVALGERSFARTQSAPASAAFFSNLRSAPTQASAGRGGLLPPPDMVPARTIHAARGNPDKKFARSKTGAANFTRSAPNVGIYAQHNKLQRSVYALGFPSNVQPPNCIVPDPEFDRAEFT